MGATAVSAAPVAAALRPSPTKHNVSVCAGIQPRCMYVGDRVPQGRGWGRKTRDSTRRRSVVGGGRPLAVLPLGATPSGESRPCWERWSTPPPTPPPPPPPTAGPPRRRRSGKRRRCGSSGDGGRRCGGGGGGRRRADRAGRLGGSQGRGAEGGGGGGWGVRLDRGGRPPPPSAPPPPPRAPPRPATPAERWRPPSVRRRRQRRPAASCLRRLPPACGPRRAGGWLGVVGVAVVVSWGGGWGVLSGGGCPSLEAPRPRSPAAPALRPTPPTLGRAAAAAWWWPRR